MLTRSASEEVRGGRAAGLQAATHWHRRQEQEQGLKQQQQQLPHCHQISHRHQQQRQQAQWQEEEKAGSLQAPPGKIPFPHSNRLNKARSEESSTVRHIAAVPGTQAWRRGFSMHSSLQQQKQQQQQQQKHELEGGVTMRSASLSLPVQASAGSANTRLRSRSIPGAPPLLPGPEAIAAAERTTRRSPCMNASKNGAAMQSAPALAPGRMEQAIGQVIGQVNLERVRVGGTLKRATNAGVKVELEADTISAFASAGAAASMTAAW